MHVYLQTRNRHREVKKCDTKARKTIQRLKDSCGTAVRERDEVVPEIPSGEAIHYILHQLLMRDQAESRTKDEDSV